jgi:DNA-binding NarL/FixJ family response regulator
VPAARLDRWSSGLEEPTVRCVVADDHPAIIVAICEFLADEGISVVARARNGKEALAAIEATQPTVAVVELRMPEMSGIDVFRAAARTSPSTVVVVYTGHVERVELTDAIDAGVRALVLKEAPLSDLVRAIETVTAGETYIDPIIAGILSNAQAKKLLHALTARERAILQLLANGQAYEQIARELHIAPTTVRASIRKAMSRLDAGTRVEAVATALRESLIK